MASHEHWWASLRHGGLLIAPSRLALLEPEPPALGDRVVERLRRDVMRVMAGSADARAELLTTVLEQVCGLRSGDGAAWLAGTHLDASWSRRGAAGESIRPRRVWSGANGASLPVFVDDQPRLGIGRGRRAVSRVLEWLRAGGGRLALLTNHTQFRLIYAGSDYDAWAEWDIALWFEEGAPSAQVTALQWLLRPQVLVPEQPGRLGALLEAVEQSRRGQAELSSSLGERVRQAVEALIQAYAEPLAALTGQGVSHRDVYVAATRVVMRMVVVLFAEARTLLPRDNPRYEASYGLQALLVTLNKATGAARTRRRLHGGAWPRVLSLFRLMYYGSYHPELLIPRYGGGLFAPGASDSDEPVRRALAVFEDPACGPHDDAVAHMLDLLCRTTMRVRAGRGAREVMVPVDFSDLSSEYIGILYEGLLDYELRRAEPDEPLVFLDLGDQPVLPLSRLEALDDAALKSLVEKARTMRQAVVSDDEADEDADEDASDEPDAEAAEPDDDSDEASAEFEATEEDATVEGEGAPEDAPAPEDDARLVAALRAHDWARRAAKVGGLVARPRGGRADALARWEAEIAAVAKRLVTRVVLPGEWFLVLWGGTRKGSGTFYTRPQLAVPTVQRTLRPLAYETEGEAGRTLLTQTWRPRPPAAILALKVCDPAVGSGSFAVAALRFLADALWRSLLHHQWLVEEGDRFVVRATGEEPPPWFAECVRDLPVTAGDAEAHVRARLRRVVVERCLYGVDMDPLAIELARLSLWVETMDRDLPFEFLDHRLKVGNALVGCWFDRFRDYPVMAWMREGGDATHTNFVHHVRDVVTTRGARRGQARQSGDVWTAAIKEWRDVVKKDLVNWIIGKAPLPFTVEGSAPEAIHAEAAGLLRQMEAIPLFEPDERARFHREHVQGHPAFQRLREAFDAWCALWFWPADHLASAPMPGRLDALSGEAHAVVGALAREHRFFHWELEFPDVFAGAQSGFDAMVGNPPWEIQKPNSKEFFSNIDPLYRSYGKQEALTHQKAYFAADAQVEDDWVRYCARHKSLSNWNKYAAFPFGDPEDAGEPFALDRGDASARLHRDWRTRRAKVPGYADPAHPFRHQGSADINTYKMFLEQAHALLRQGGRLGLIVPSGVYTDKGSTALRTLFLEHCRWEWLFAFENRDKIFDIHRSFKFCPVIVAKGGTTESIHTAFMRHDLRDWEEAERHAVAYPRSQVTRFSPHTQAILEVRGQRDLEVLEKIYANSVLLGDTGPDGWGIRYATEFHMTNDSKLFPPRPQWEAKGYRPDEYGRWIKFRDSRPVEEHPAEVGWIRLADGSVVVQEDAIEDVALPLYEGRMIGQFDFSEKGWVSGKGRSAVWRDIPWSGKKIEPQYLMSSGDYVEALVERHVTAVGEREGDDAGERERERLRGPNALADFLRGLDQRVGFMDVSSATNSRSMIASAIPRMPAGNKVPLLVPSGSDTDPLSLLAILNSLSYDYSLRARFGGLSLNYFIVAETVLPRKSPLMGVMASLAMRVACPSVAMAHLWVGWPARERPWRSNWAVTAHERLRTRCLLEALLGLAFGLERDDFAWIVHESDRPQYQLSSRGASERDPKGFWRIDKDREPELRLPVLAYVAFCDVCDALGRSYGDVVQERALSEIREMVDIWQLPEELCLADYGLGHDDRAKVPQPVRSRLGERFYPWQLEQSAEESWADCERHARNLLGAEGFARLKAEIAGESTYDVAESGVAKAADRPVPQDDGAPKLNWD